MLSFNIHVISSEVGGLVALVAERMVVEVVEEDPSLVEEVSRHHVEPCLGVEASRTQVEVAFLPEIRDLVAWEVGLMVVGALVALGGSQGDLVGGVAFLLVVELVEEACILPSYQEEEEQE